VTRGKVLYRWVIRSTSRLQSNKILDEAVYGGALSEQAKAARSAVAHATTPPSLQHLPVRIRHELYGFARPLDQPTTLAPQRRAQGLKHKIRLLPQVQVLPEEYAAKELHLLEGRH